MTSRTTVRAPGRRPPCARKCGLRATSVSYFYMVARMFDPDIARLRMGLARRDNFLQQQDWFSIAIDPVGSRRVSQLFYFNPTRVIYDARGER
jgi:hypothetical protein